MIEISKGDWANWAGVRLRQGEGISGSVIATGKPYVNNEVLSNTRFARPDLIGDLKAVACVPLITQGQAIGAIWVGRRSDIEEYEIKLLTAIGEIAANAIQRDTLYEQTEQRLQRLYALHAIDMAISASLDLRVTLNILLEHVTTQLNTDAATVLLLNPSTGILEYAASRGFRARTIKKTHLRIGWVQVGYWRDYNVLFRHAQEATEKNWAAWNNLGAYHLRLKQYPQAIEAFREALAIKPDLALARENMGFAYSGLIIALYREGRREEALEAYRQLRRLDPAKAEMLLGMGQGTK